MQPLRTAWAVMFVLALVSVSGMARAQSSETEGGWTSLSFAGGLSSGSSDTGFTVGGTFIYELTPRLALEATGGYLDRGAGADAFDLTGGLLVSLVPSAREIVPYVAAGGGLYRASYDLGHRRFLGPLAGQLDPGMATWPGMGPGMMGPGFGPGPFFDDFAEMPVDDFFGEMPHFYTNRLGNIVIPGTGSLGPRSFTDPVVNFGGGVRIDFGPRVFIRPDARVLMVVAEGDTYSLGVFTVNVGYRF